MRRNVLISGASSGLGAEMARQFAARGHNVALAARRQEQLEDLRDSIVAAHPKITVSVHRLDVIDPEQVWNVMTSAIGAHGALDRVIVNAGLGKGGRIGGGYAPANRQTMTTNVLGSLNQAEAAMEHFYERGSGHLVLISSMSAMRGMPGAMNAYAASKVALGHLAEGIRSDLIGRRDHDIAVTTLFPGYIATEMNARVAGKQPLTTGLEAGCQAMVAAIDREVATKAVPGWPWALIAPVLKYAPLGLVRRMI